MNLRIASALCLLLLAVAAPAQVLINEFDSGTPDAIELHNRGFAPVDVGGWSVSTWFRDGGTGAMTAETPFTIPAGTMIPAGGFLVLQENGTPGSPGTLPNSIFVGINYLWTSTRSIEIALFDNTNTGVDYVFANRGGGGNPAPNLPAGQSWTGTLSSSASNDVWRNQNQDNDAASDWTVQTGNTFGALNPGQSIADPVTLTLSSTGMGQVTIDVVTTPSLPNRQIYNLFSLMDFTPNGSGPFFGVGLDVIPQLSLPGPPFSAMTNGAGTYTLALPVGTVPPGLFFEGVTLLVNGGNVIFSPVDEIQF